MSWHALNVYVHVLATVVWAGGMIFLGPIAAPAIRRVEPASMRSEIFLAVGRRFRPVGWACVVLLLVTGLLNLSFLGRNPFGDPAILFSPPFGHKLLTKLVLFLVVIALSALHDFAWGPRAFALGPDHPEGDRYRRRAIATARVNAVLVLVIIFLGVSLGR